MLFLTIVISTVMSARSGALVLLQCLGFCQFMHLPLGSISIMIEALAHKEGDGGCVSTIIDFLLTKTLATKLFPPLQLILANPLMAVVLILVVYLIFLVLFAPLWLASLLISAYGSFGLLGAIICLIARRIGRSMSFPGCTTGHQRDVAVDYLIRLTTQLENIATNTANFTATLMLVVSGKVAITESTSVERNLREILSKTSTLPSLSLWLDAAIVELSFPGVTTADELEPIIALKKSIDGISQCMAEMAPVASIAVQASNLSINMGTYGQKTSQGSQLIVLAGRCLQASDNLKTAVLAIRPKKSDDEGAAAVIAGLLKFTKSMTGAEKLSFPLMRAMILSRNKAKRCSIRGKDDNIIDTIIIPAQSGNKSSAGAGPPVSRPSALGTVLFCSPNAGFYECMSMATANDNSWLSLYTSLGFDVCLFNYRGYNASTGTPSPSNVQSDGESVVQYLRSHHHITKLLVHGESIGGLTACHVARVCEADLLVCDRTFASLDAIASRMLGSWAGLGLRYLGGYYTNVAKDYLQCKCNKIIIQDPADQVIANPASLKNGIATQLVLGDNSWPRKSLPHVYIMADAQGQAVPAVAAADEALLAAEGQGLLKEAFINHFFACVLYFSRRCRVVMTNKINLAKQDSKQSLDHNRLQQQRGNDTSNVEMTRFGRQLAARTLRDTQQGSSDDCNDDMNDMESCNSTTSRSSTSTISASASACSSASRVATPSPKSNCHVGSRLYQRQAELLERLWNTLVCIDGGSGQLLGQAAAAAVNGTSTVTQEGEERATEDHTAAAACYHAGLEGVRAWVCAAIIWPMRTAPDYSMPSNRHDLFRAVILLREIQCLMSAVWEDLQRGTGGTECCSPMRGADSSEAGGDSESSSGTGSGTTSGRHCPHYQHSDDIQSVLLQADLAALDYLVRSMSAVCRRFVHCAQGRCADLSSLVVPAAAATQNPLTVSQPGSTTGGWSNAYSTSDRLSEWNGESIPITPADIGCGACIAVHCGHSGWPAAFDIHALVKFFQCSGFPIRNNNK